MVTALTQQVEQTGGILQQYRQHHQPVNQLVNGQPNRWSRRLYPVQLANAGTVPSFSDIPRRGANGRGRWPTRPNPGLYVRRRYRSRCIPAVQWPADTTITGARREGF